MGYLDLSTAIETPEIATTDMEYAELYSIYYPRFYNYLKNNNTYKTQKQNLQNQYINYNDIPDMTYLFRCFDKINTRQVVTLFNNAVNQQERITVSTILEQIDTQGETVDSIARLAERISICILGYCKLYAFSIPAFFTTLTFATDNWTNFNNSIFSSETNSDGFLTKDFIENYQKVISNSNGGFNGYIYNNFINSNSSSSSSNTSQDIYGFTEEEQTLINNLKQDYGLLCAAVTEIIIPGRETSTETDSSAVNEAADAEILSNLPACLIEYFKYNCDYQFTPTLLVTGKPLTEEQKQEQQDIYDKYENATGRDFIVDRENHKIYYINNNGEKVFILGDDT